jgi:hypothetical protein
MVFSMWTCSTFWTMLGLMSNCQVDTDVPLEYQSPMESSEHLDENGEEMKRRIVNWEFQRDKQDP